jgi:3-hydroxy-9,10-secoandrosta-1,3,5(10)-triene-9,17-dione monooxygenase reductase component
VDHDHDAALAALAHAPLAVVIIGAANGEARSCSTGTLTYVSIDPPMLATPIAPSSRTGALALQTGRVSVSILAADQAGIAVAAGKSATSTDKFAELGIPVLDPGGDDLAPGVAGCVAALWCEIDATVGAGDHVLCVLRVTASQRAGGTPLVRCRRRYHALGEAIDVAGEPPYPL